MRVERRLQLSHAIWRLSQYELVTGRTGTGAQRGSGLACMSPLGQITDRLDLGEVRSGVWCLHRTVVMKRVFALSEWRSWAAGV
jgi:hypothetical protein